MFDADHMYIGTAGEFVMELYPTQRMSKARSVFDAWFAIVRSGEDAAYYGRRMGMKAIEGILEKSGFGLADLDWASFPCEKVDGPPWRRDVFTVYDVIYFISAIGSGRIKIGWAKDLYKRVDYIMAACPYPIEVVGYTHGDCKGEMALHRRFSHIHLHNEWFQDCQELRDFIAALPSQSEATQAYDEG